VLGVLGRATRALLLCVVRDTSWKRLEEPLLRHSVRDASFYTDDWCGYKPLRRHGRTHHACCHVPGRRVWAIDLDADGVREVHCNTLEGIWTGLRNFLRSFRGVSKRYLQQYAGVFQDCFNLKQNDWMSLFRRMLRVNTKLGA
jgi:transposase